MGLLFCIRVHVTSLSLAAWPSPLGLVGHAWQCLHLGPPLPHPAFSLSVLSVSCVCSETLESVFPQIVGITLADCS